MSTGISPENERFLEAAVTSGVFSSRGEALDQAVALLRERAVAIERIRRHRVALPSLPAALERRPDGAIYFAGHRISLGVFLNAVYAGGDQAELASQFTGLDHQAIADVLAYIATNEQIVRGYFEQYEALDRLQRDDSRRGPGVNELRSRLRGN
ncbi:MAG: hypothetical protein M3Y90_14515 [Actinomycetota bacterium]|nr:hypothetical protein [Actinomycetota bacterium]